MHENENWTIIRLTLVKLIADLQKEENVLTISLSHENVMTRSEVCESIFKYLLRTKTIVWYSLEYLIIKLHETKTVV